LFVGQLSGKRRNVRLGLGSGAVGLDQCMYVRLRLADGCLESLAFREHAMFDLRSTNGMSVFRAA